MNSQWCRWLSTQLSNRVRMLFEFFFNKRIKEDELLTFKSKCMKPRSCMYLTASKTCLRIFTASNSGRESPSIRLNKSPPLQLK